MTYVIAEVGVNHNGDVDLGRRMIDAAVETGADAVKVQTFRADRLVSPTAGVAPYARGEDGTAGTQYDLLRGLELDRDAHVALARHCRSLGCDFVSTPFDADSARFLVEEIGVPWLKMPSGEIVNGPLLWAASRMGVPLVISTGMATFGEIETALAVVTQGMAGHAGAPDPSAVPGKSELAGLADRVTLLHCTTAYPAPYADVNLRCMTGMAQRFGLSVGLSDHTPGTAAAVGATACGATVIEKHFTTDCTLPGPDQAASLEPTDFRRMVDEIRIVAQCLGEADKGPTPSERENMFPVRQGIVAARAITRGEAYTAEALTTRRPAAGASPMRYWSLLGQVADRDYEAGEPIEQ